MGLFSSAPTDKSKKAKIKVLKDEPCLMRLSISVSSDRVLEETEKAFERIQQQAKVPGFRPGKAPLDVVRKSFSDLASQRTRESLLREAVREAVVSQGLEPVQPPVVKDLSFKSGEPLSFELEVERAPRIELKAYKGLKVEKKLRKIEDTDVTERLEQIRESNAKLAESPRQRLEAGLFAVLDYEGFVDGRPAPGLRGTQVLVDTAHPQMITGLAEGIMGMEKNQTKEIQITFPSDSLSKELAGKQVVFKVTLQAMKEKKLPSLDDEFANDLGCASLEDLKSKIKGSLEDLATRESRESLERQLIDKLLEEHIFPVPPSLLEEQTRYQTAVERDRWIRRGGREEEWRDQETAVISRLRPECERQLRVAYLVREICRLENITVEEREVEETIAKMAGSATPPEQTRFRQALESGKERIASDIRNRKVYDFLVNHAKIKEA